MNKTLSLKPLGVGRITLTSAGTMTYLASVLLQVRMEYAENHLVRGRNSS